MLYERYLMRIIINNISQFRWYSSLFYNKLIGNIIIDVDEML